MAKSSKMSGGCLMIFCLPFAAVGIGAMIWLGMLCNDYFRMQNWREVPATIKTAELERQTSSSSKGTRTTYLVHATYTYTLNGKTYDGDRVSIHAGSDNVGNFHERTFNELEEYRKSGKPFRCYVNPARPDESILYRGLRWEMVGFILIFALAFGGAGIGMFIGGVISFRRNRLSKQMAQQNPDTPWLWKPQWAEGKIKSGSAKAAIGVSAFALVWLVITTPIGFFALSEELPKGNNLVLLILLFPAIGLIVLAFGLYFVLRWFKYGESVFEMTTLPGVLGGPLAGVVRTKVKVRPDTGFTVVLSCINRVTTTHRSGGKTSTSTTEHVRWQNRRVIKHELLERDPTQSAIPVRFGIPYDQPASSTESSNNEIVWRLEVSAEVPGVDYAVTFEVPVFKTEESNPEFQLVEDPFSALDETEDLLAQLRAANIHAERLTSGGLRVVFPMARHKGGAIGLTVFFLIWSGVVLGLGLSDAPLMFPIIFGFFDLLIFIGVLYAWLYSGRFEVSHQHLTMVGGLFGAGSPKRLSASEIESLNCRQTMQSGSKVFFGIFAKTRDGRNYTIARSVGDQQMTEALLTEIQGLLYGDK